jgi:probable rRNA maturation factor
MPDNDPPPKQYALVTIESPLWSCLENQLEPLAQKLTTLVLSDFNRDGEVSFLFSDNKTIQHLNHQYRHKDKPTNVLSFPSNIPSDIVSQLGEHSPPLGDIVLAFETLDQEARLAGKPFLDHLVHLMIHGLLHLLGYDHETVPEAAAMEALEIQFLQQLSIPNPYLEEAPHEGC